MEHPQISDFVGKIGAKRQTVRSANPRALLADLMERNHSASERTIFEDCWDLFKSREDFEEPSDPSLFKTIFEYWFANNYRSIVLGAPETRSLRRSEVTRKIGTLTTDYADRIEQAIEHKAKVTLLRLLMPNGKKLADCTGSDCESMAAEVGQFLSALAAALSPQETVGSKFTEASLQDLYGHELGKQAQN